MLECGGGGHVPQEKEENGILTWVHTQRSEIIRERDWLTMLML